MSQPNVRAVLRYFGGKMRLAPWIVAQFPEHDHYVEPFCGAASVFFAKRPARYREVLNDLDHEIVNLFATLRGPDGPELIRQVALTPWSRLEYDRAHDIADTALERARRLLVRSHMSYASLATETEKRRGFRSRGAMDREAVTVGWNGLPAALDQAARRLLAAQIECRDAFELMADFDDPTVLIYLDPPYWPEARTQRFKDGQLYHGYRHELDREGHLRLLEVARQSRAMIALSGYACEEYDEGLHGWSRLQRHARSHKNAARLETLWINPALAGSGAGPLFGTGQ